MNRAQRRSATRRVVIDIMKGREKAIAKKQWGLGFVFTNLMGMITVGPRIFVIYDKRLK